MRNYIQDVVAPLTEETKKLFKPLRLSRSDYLHVSMGGDGWFIVEAKSHDWKYLEKRAVVSGEHIWSEKRSTSYASSDASNYWLERVPEKSRMPGSYGKWRIAATDFNALMIHSLFGNRIIWDDEEAKLTYSFLITRFVSQNQSALLRAEFKSKSREEKKAMADDLVYLDHADFPLMPYQKVALHGCMHQEASALMGMEQGTGKSAIVVARNCNEADQFSKKNTRLYRTLIVCPKNVRSNWVQQYVQFATVPGKVTVIRGDKIDRMRQVIEAMVPNNPSEKWTTVVVSYGSLVASWDILGAIEWDLMAADESHFFKNVMTTRYKTMMKARLVARQRMCLTGTPITNWMLDLFAQFEFLGEGMSGFTTWKAFKKFYGKWEQRGRFNALVDYKNLPLIQERLQRLSFMITKKEALPDLPDKVYKIEDVDMTKEQAAMYEKVQCQMAIEIEDDLARAEQSGLTKSLVINNILTKMLKLAQVTSGFVKYPQLKNEWGCITQRESYDRFDPNPKLERLVTLLQERGRGEKTLIWVCWVQDIKTIANRLASEDIKAVTFYGKTTDKARVAAEKAYNNDPAMTVFIGNAAAGGVGLNLQGYNVLDPENSLTNTVQEIYFSQNWSMVYRAQSEDRGHRKGTRLPVEIIDLCVPNSIDGEIRIRVTEKRNAAFEIQDCRDVLKRLLAFRPRDSISEDA